MLRELENLLSNEIDPAYSARARFIFETIDKEKPRRVLEVGCGRGFYLHVLSFFPFIKEIYGIDVSEKYLSVAKKHCRDKRINIQVGDVYRLAFPDNSFDIVIASEVLEHLKNDRKALEEIKRVLKPQGVLLVTVPNNNFPFCWDPLNWLLMKFFNTHVNKNIWWLAGIWADHEKLYTNEELISNVSFSFKIESVKNSIHFCLPFSHFLLYGVGKNIVERFNVKSVDRFSFRKNNFSAVVSSIFRFPSRFEKQSKEYKSSMNILLKARKMNQ